MAEVRTTFTSDDKSVQAALERMNRDMTKLREANKRLSEESRRGSREAATGFKAVGLEVLAIAGGARAAGRLVMDAFRAQEQWRKEAEKTAIAIDTANRRLRIQGNLNAVQGQEAQAQAQAISARSGVSQIAINRIATEAVSQGFAGPMDVAKSLIAALQSSNIDPESADLEGIVAGLAQFTRAGGKMLTPESLTGPLLATRGLFKDTPIQLSDLAQFSSARVPAAGLGISDRDFLAQAAVAKSIDKEPSKAATGLKQVYSRLSAPTPEATRAMRAMGINPEAVDLVGESVPDALRELGRGFAATPEKKRAGFARMIFGQEAAAFAQAMVGRAQEGTFEKYGEFAGDVKGFEFGVNVARGGPAAAIAKANAEKDAAVQALVDAGGLTDAEAVPAYDAQVAKIRASLKGSPLQGALFEIGEALFGRRGIATVGGTGGAALAVPDEAYLGPEARARAHARRKGDFSVDELPVEPAFPPGLSDAELSVEIARKERAAGRGVPDSGTMDRMINELREIKTTLREGRDAAAAAAGRERHTE